MLIKMLSENEWKQRDKNESMNKEARHCRGTDSIWGYANSRAEKQKESQQKGLQPDTYWARVESKLGQWQTHGLQRTRSGFRVYMGYAGLFPHFTKNSSL
jgi:hypothetical protein